MPEVEVEILGDLEEVVALDDVAIFADLPRQLGGGPEFLVGDRLVQSHERVPDF